MSGNDLSEFIGLTLTQVAPLVLAATVGALFAVSVLSGIVSFMDRG
jgi:hypothetical protein